MWVPGCSWLQSSLLHGTVCTQPSACIVLTALRDLENRLLKWTFTSILLVPLILGSKCALRASLESPSAWRSGLIHISQVIMFTCTELQNEEQMTWDPMAGQVQAPWPLCMSPRRAALPSLMRVSVMFQWLKKWLILQGCRVKHISNHGHQDKWQTLHSQAPQHCFLPCPIQIKPIQVLKNIPQTPSFTSIFKVALLLYLTQIKKTII